MTYLGRLDHFVCDLCKLEVTCNGFPKHWIWFTDQGTKHACEKCKEQIPPKQQHNPKS